MQQPTHDSKRAAVRWDPQLGNRCVKEHLARRGLSLAGLARMSGVGYYPLIRSVLGYTRASTELRAATARALDLSPEELWGET